MEEMNKKENKGMCDCLNNNGFHMHHGMTRRLALLILIVVIAFWFGMKLGEIKGYVMANHGYSSMHQRGMMMYDMRGEKDEERTMKVEMQTPPTPTTAPTN